MKNNLISLAVCVFMVLMASMLTHWLIGLTVIFIVMALTTPPTWTAFAIGFLSVFLVWAGSALYHSTANHHLLANQIGDLFGGISPMVLLILTGILGGLAGGLIASSATLIFGRKEGKFGL